MMGPMDSLAQIFAEAMPAPAGLPAISIHIDSVHVHLCAGCAKSPADWPPQTGEPATPKPERR